MLVIAAKVAVRLLCGPVFFLGPALGQRGEVGDVSMVVISGLPKTIFTQHQ